MNDYETSPYDGAPIQSYDYVNTDAEGNKGCRNWAIGCSLVMLVFLVLLGVGGYFLARHGVPLAARAVAEGIEGVVKEADLPPEQKRQIVQRVDQLSEDFIEGNLTLDELGEIVENIVESRAFIAGGAEFVIRTQLIDELDIDEERQAQIKRLLQRLARGIVEEYLDPEDFEPLKDIVLVQTGENKYEVKDDLTKEEIEEFLVGLEKMVNDAEVPDEPYEVDIAGELDRIVDEVHNRRAR